MKSVKMYTSARSAQTSTDEGQVDETKHIDEDDGDKLSSFVSVIMGNQHQHVDPVHIWGPPRNISFTTCAYQTPGEGYVLPPPSE